MSNNNIINKINNLSINTDNMVLNKSPLRYPGGKTRACKILDKIFNEYFNNNEFEYVLSPFFGGGSFEFYLQNKYNFKLIVNDKFTPLYNFWKQIKLDKEILYTELNKIENVSKDLFIEYRKTIMNLNDNILQQSIQFFVINRCSFSGSTLSGGFSKESSNKRFTKSSIDKIKKLDLTNVELYNEDFEDFINNNIHYNNTLLFLDPPYYLEKKSKLYGDNGNMHNDFNHIQLFNVVNTKNNWILTYNNCNFIRNLYKDYLILDAEWSYSMNKTKKSSEIIIISYKK